MAIRTVAPQAALLPPGLFGRRPLSGIAPRGVSGEPGADSLFTCPSLLPSSSIHFLQNCPPYTASSPNCSSIRNS